MTPAMIHLCCPHCRLRFSADAAAHLGACPDCGEPLQASSLQDTVGFRLVSLEAGPPSMPQAVAVSIAMPDPSGAPR